MVNSLTNPLLGGFLAAGILAAIMSSLDSQILCVGTMFASDLVGGTSAGKRLSEAQQIWIARIFVVIVMAATWGISLVLIENRSVFGLAVWCFTGFAGLFPLVFAALYWKKLTAAGALSAILTMATSWGFLFYKSGFGAVQNYSCKLNVFGNNIEIEPVAIVFAATSISMVLTSLITRAPDARRMARFFPAKPAINR
jgi:SSS family solute:Na+ symporter